MFERFTESSRHVVIRAQERARELHHDFIGSEHLLLALVDDPEDGLSTQILTSLGVAAPDLQAEIVRINGRGELSSPRQMPFTPPAKKVLELALRESLSLGHTYVGTEHLLLAIVRDPSTTAARLLRGREVTPEQVRGEVMNRLAPASPQRAKGVARAGPGWNAIPTAPAAAASSNRDDELQLVLMFADPPLRRMLKAAAAQAMTEGRSTFGLDDVNAQR